MNSMVSVIMPSYNTGKYISASIQSVQAQTYAQWELLIVDDCSTDDTDTVVQGFLDDPRIKYFKNEKNCGAALSRNRALREAKGKWIAFLDSDDLWHPDKLEKQVLFMERNKYRFSYTMYSEINDSGQLLGKIITGPKVISRKGFLRYCWPGCLTVMYDSTLANVQIADIKKNNDYAMWLCISRYAECYLLPEILASYRRHTGSISNHSYFELIKWHYRLFREAEGQPSLYAIVNTGKNVFFGIIKKIMYVRK